MLLGKTPFISWHLEDDVAWIDLLFVPREQRRQGHGTSMVATVIGQLPGCVRLVEVLAAQIDEELSTGFWEKLGFEAETDFGELFNGTYLRKPLAAAVLPSSPPPPIPAMESPPDDRLAAILCEQSAA